jgi:hypothetical protein
VALSLRLYSQRRRLTMKSIRLTCRCGHAADLDAARFSQFTSEGLNANSVSGAYGKFRCRRCGSRETRVEDDSQRVLIDPDSIVVCRDCGCPIPLPRLAARPGTTLCTICTDDNAASLRAPAYPQPADKDRKCPRCGHPTVVREPKGGGDYFLACTSYPACHWTGAFIG